jgi:hypothetical protein
MILRSYKTIINKILFVNFVLVSGRFTHSWLKINCIPHTCIQYVGIHKISYLRQIRLHCIHTNLTTTAYIDGSIKVIGDQSEISIFVDYSHYKKLFNLWRNLRDIFRKHHEEHYVCDVFLFFVTDVHSWILKPRTLWRFVEFVAILRCILVFRHGCALMDIEAQNIATIY